MKSLHRETKESEEEIGRVRNARPGETTLYDEVSGEGVKHFYRMFDSVTKQYLETHDEVSANYFYNEVDAEEDLILFPDEAAGASTKAITGAGIAAAYAFPDLEMPNMKRFVLDLDSDEDEHDMEDPFDPVNKKKKKAIRDKLAAQKQTEQEED